MPNPPDNARLFIALWPDPTMREQLREWRDSFAWPKAAAPVRTQQLHVTLHFLGNIPRERVPELVQGLAIGFAPFDLDLDHAELWRGGIAVLAPNLEPSLAPPPLLALHGAIGEALQRLGLPLEARPYRPHVTLARRAGRELLPTTQCPPVRWRADGYCLMESKLGASAEYGVVRRYPAAGPQT